MVKIYVEEEYKNKAKKQIEEFEKSPRGNWRYKGVSAWKGIVGEFVVSDYLKSRISISFQDAKGLDTSGIEDDYDVFVADKKIEIKTATENFHRLITPKKEIEQNKSKDFYIGAKYIANDSEGDYIQIYGYIEGENLKNYGTNQLHGAPYYEIPLSDLKNLDILINYLNSKEK